MSQSLCRHKTLAVLSASDACSALNKVECRCRDNYEKLAKRVSHK